MGSEGRTLPGGSPDALERDMRSVAGASAFQRLLASGVLLREPCSSQAGGNSGQNQLLTKIESGASQQFCHHGFLKARCVKLDANDALRLVEGDLPDAIDFPHGVEGVHGRLS